MTAEQIKAAENEEIIYCDGRYEVHPRRGAWVVINSETGNEHSSYDAAAQAVELAKSLNAE